MFSFTPLYGAQSASPASASILEFDGGIKVLVDIGWDETFSGRFLSALESHVPTISLVLLTHPTLDHIGAYAYACKNIPLFSRIPVYATIPVINLGLTLLTDLYASTELAAATILPEALGATSIADDTPNFLLQPPTADEIATYFNRISPLKYSQPHQPAPVSASQPLSGLTITAYGAGHTLGGTIWHLQHGLESVVYATDWNQTKENLLGGAAWLSSAAGGAEIIEPLRRPTALICSSKGVQVEDGLTRKKRDEALISMIRDTLVQGGNVLIPTDSSARVLEIAYLLNQAWRDNIDGPHAATYSNAKVYMASTCATATRRYLQSMLEWMDDSIVRNAEASMTGKGKDRPANPLEWNYIHTIERQSQLDRALSRAKSSIILAGDSSLTWGYSQYALRKLADNPRNLIVFSEMPQMSANSAAAQIWQAHSAVLGRSPSEQADASKGSSSTISITVQNPEILKLVDNETEVFAQYMIRQQALSSASAGVVDDSLGVNEAAEASLDAAASDSSDSEDEDENEAVDAQHQGRALNLSAQLTSNKRKVGYSEVEYGVDLLLTGKEHDYDVQGKRGRDRMFPFRQTRKRGDDFGDTIVVTEYLRAEEKEEIDSSDVVAGQDRKLGEKRKWDDVSAVTPVTAKGRQAGKRQRLPNGSASQDNGVVSKDVSGANGNQSSDSDSEQSEYEPDDADDDRNVPKKVDFSKTIELSLSAKVRYVDFSALHDKRDLLMLIPLIRPRKLIIISGSEEDTQILAENTRPFLEQRSTRDKTNDTLQASVYTPKNGELVDASVDTHAWTLKLGRSLVRKIVWQDIRGIGVVALTGQLTSDTSDAKDEAVEVVEDDIARKKRKLGTSIDAAPAEDDEKSDGDKLPVLDLPASNAAGFSVQTTSVNKSIHVGDLRLSDLRNLLRAAGHTADFRGEGTLLVDGIVVVRKGAGGRIEVEGNVFGTNGRGAVGEMIFGDVRKKIYQGLAVIGGGQTAVA